MTSSDINYGTEQNTDYNQNQLKSSFLTIETCLPTNSGKKSVINFFTPTEIQAAIEYIKRQAGESHPDGDSDNADRWYPCKVEWCECCEGIRDPSRAWPDSLRKHCCSATHVATLFGASPSTVRKAVRAIRSQKIPAVLVGGEN